MPHRDLRNALFVLALSVALLAGDFRVPFIGFDVTVRALILVLLTGVAPLIRPTIHARRPVGFVAGFIYAWIAWMAISSLWSPNPATAGVVSDLLWMALAVALTVHVARTVEVDSLDLVWWFWLAASSIYLLLALASGPDAQGRLTLPWGGPNVFVRVMAIGVVAAAFLAYRRRVIWPWPIALALSIGAILSGSRGGILGLAIVIALAAFPLARKLRGGTLALLGFYGVGLGFLAWNFFRESEPVQAIVEFASGRFVEETFVEGYSSGRDTIFGTAVEIARDHPAYGAGLDSWQVLQNTGFVHPHNLFLSTAVDGGFIGVVLLTLALGIPLFQVATSRSRTAGTWAALAGALLIFVSAMFSGYYYDSRLLWFFLILAVAYSTADQTEAATQDRSKARVSPSRLG